MSDQLDIYVQLVGHLDYNMDSPKEQRLIERYLNLMSVKTATSHIMLTAKLKDLRPATISQADLAKQLGKSRTSINSWEKGEHLDGINSSDIIKMALIFNRRIEEVVAAIENTRLLTKEENN